LKISEATVVDLNAKLNSAYSDIGELLEREEQTQEENEEQKSNAKAALAAAVLVRNPRRLRAVILIITWDVDRF
jgi:hypothetical protein